VLVVQNIYMNNIKKKQEQFISEQTTNQELGTEGTTIS
jgi:hypothetical protein